MKRRLFSLCMALVLCLSLLPATALAADGYTVYVGGVALTGSTGSPAYATTDKDTGVVTPITSTDGEPVNWNIKWDGSTLTLRNATIKKELYDSGYIAGAAIGVLNQSGDAELTITLEGTNTIEDVSAAIHVFASSGSANLTITGDGILSASSVSNPGIRVQSNTGNGTLAITDAKVTASSSSSGNGVQIRVGVGSNASLTVNGGSLTATGSGVTFTGIKMQFGSSDSSTGTPTVTVSGNAIVRANGSAGEITSNSSTEVRTAAGTGESGGIVWNGKNGTVYGDVTLQEDLTIGEDESLTIPDGASLDTNGKLTVNGGTLTQNGTVTGDIIYKVTGVSLNADSLTLVEGGTATLTATITPSNATNQNVTWCSDDESVATVSGGVVTAVGEGTATITATAADGSGEKATCSVTVNAAATGPTITTQPSNQSVTEGQTASFSVAAAGNGTLTYQWQESTDGSTWTNIDGANAATYTIENTTAAMSGYQYRCMVTNSIGTVTSQAATLTVTAATVPVTGVTLNKTSTSLYVGDTETLTATITPDNATNKNVTWSSDNPSVASVNNGVVTAVGAGTATITVTTTDGGFTATCTVTVSRYSSGGGSDSGEPSYSPVLDVSGGGDVKISPRTPSQGDEVTLTVTPDEGYQVEAVSVTDQSGREVAVTENRDGAYTFEQPRGRVTIEVTFRETAPALPFADVPGDFWAADAIAWAYENGYVSGITETSFTPNAAVSRQQVWMILARVSGRSPAAMAEARAWALDFGISDGTNPGGAVTRQQLAALLYRYAQSRGMDVSVGENTNILSYADAFDVAEYAVPAVQWACGAGILSGTGDGRLNPAGPATRAQFAVMLYRFLA